MFFLTGVTEYLGEGGTERVAAYVIPIGLALAGSALWRLAGPGRPTGAPSARRPGGAGRAGARARRRARGGGPARAERTASGGAGTADEDELDDHWAPVGGAATDRGQLPAGSNRSTSATGTAAADRRPAASGA